MSTSIATIRYDRTRVDDGQREPAVPASSREAARRNPSADSWPAGRGRGAATGAARPCAAGKVAKTSASTAAADKNGPPRLRRGGPRDLREPKSGDLDGALHVRVDQAT